MHMTDKEYNRYVAGLAKKSPLWKDLLNSFWIGGLICALGQLIGNGWKMAGLDKDAAATACRHDRTDYGFCQRGRLTGN